MTFQLTGKFSSSTHYTTGYITAQVTLASLQNTSTKRAIAMATAILESLPSSLTSAVESVNSALPVSDELNEYLNEAHLPSASLQLSFLPGTRTLSKFLPEHECTLHVVDEVLFASLYWLACYFGLHLLFNRLQHYISHQEGAGKQRIGPFPLERARSLADRAKNFLFLVAIIYFGFAGHSRAFARPHPAKFCNDEAIWNWYMRLLVMTIIPIFQFFS